MGRQAKLRRDRRESELVLIAKILKTMGADLKSRVYQDTDGEMVVSYYTDDYL
jgi:hypothetical protein